MSEHPSKLRAGGHTSGPWEYHENGLRKGSVCEENGNSVICAVFDMNLRQHGKCPIRQANGNLIAQAPALLRQRDELVKAAVKTLNFLVLYRGFLTNEEMTESEFHNDSGVPELNEILDKIRESKKEPT